MTRGRKLSVSSIRERVDNILGIDRNPYDLPPIWKEEKHRFGVEDPDSIPIIGKYLKVEPKPKNTRWRQRSSSLPARYQACYALTDPKIVITMDHLLDYDRRDNLYYDYFPHLRPVYLEDWEDAHREWDIKCMIRHFQNNPPLGYMPGETSFEADELIKPRRAPFPPGYVPPRPKSKALPPLPPPDERLTKDTTYLIGQFPSPPPDGASASKPATRSKSKPIRRGRASSESVVHTHSQYYREARRREQRGERPEKNDPNGDDDVGNFVGMSGRVVQVAAPAPQAPPTRSRKPSKATPPVIQAIPQFNPFRAPGGYDVETASINASIRRDVAPAEKEVVRGLAHRAALEKLKSTQVDSSAAQPQEAPHEPELTQQETTEPTRRDGTRAKEGQERKTDSEQKQRQRLRSESKIRQEPSSSSSAEAQNSRRERPRNEEPRAHKPSHTHVEQQAAKPKEEARRESKEAARREHKEDARREHKHEEERRPRERIKTDPERQVRTEERPRHEEPRSRKHSQAQIEQQAPKQKEEARREHKSKQEEERRPRERVKTDPQHQSRPEEPRQRKPSQAQVEQAPKQKEEARREHKEEARQEHKKEAHREHKQPKQEEERQPRQRTRTDPSRQGGPESLSSRQAEVQAVAQEPPRHVESQPEAARRARPQQHSEQEVARRRVVRRSVSTSQLTDMAVRARVAYGPFTNAGPLNRGHVQAPIAPWTKLPTHSRPAHAATPSTSSNHGVHAAPATTNGPPPSSTTQPMPKAVRARPSRVNLGPPPSASAGTSGAAYRKRAPSLPTSEAPASIRSEEKIPPITTRVVETLKRKVSTSSIAVSTQTGEITHRVVETIKRKISISNMPAEPPEPTPFIDKTTISVPVKYINGGETGLQQLRHAELFVRDLKKTEIELPYYVKYPPTPQSVLYKVTKRCAKAAAAAAVEAEAAAAARAAAAAAAVPPPTPPPSEALPALPPKSVPSSPDAGQTLFVPGHLASDCPSSASSYGSNASTFNEGGGYSTSMTSLNHPIIFPRRTSEDSVSSSVSGKIIPPASLRTTKPLAPAPAGPLPRPPTTTTPRARKTSMTITVPKHGAPLTKARSPPQSPPPDIELAIDSTLAELASATRAARDVKAGKQKEVAPAPPASPVESVWEDEEAIKGYKPRRIVDVKRLIREHEHRVRMEREGIYLDNDPVPVAGPSFAPLRVAGKIRNLAAQN